MKYKQLRVFASGSVWRWRAKARVRVGLGQTGTLYGRYIERFRSTGDCLRRQHLRSTGLPPSSPGTTRRLTAQRLGRFMRSDSAHMTSNVAAMQCGVCGRGFAHASTLAQHVRIHDGVRPYACTAPHCDKTFRYKARPSMLGPPASLTVGA